MTLRTKFLLFIFVMHAILVSLSFYIFQSNKLLFIGSEFFILLSLAISWQLYTEMIQPLQLLMRGTDALRDRDFNVKFSETGKPEMDKLVTIYNNMIDQIRTERTAQQEQHFFLEQLILTSPTGILILDYDEKIVSVNPKAEAILSLNEKAIKGKNLEKTGHFLLKNAEKLEINAPKTVNTEGGKIFKIQKAQFIDRGFTRLFVLLEELTAEIVEAEKNAYGKVIRMMAHEVNNSIGAVNSILDTSLSFEQNADVANALRVAIGRNDHLNVFMRNFADVIRLPEPRLATLNLNDLVGKVSDLMRFKAQEKNTQIVVEMAENTPLSIKADATQLEQVFINIVKNALESIDNQGVVRFIIQPKNCRLIIENNGKPIPTEIMPLLFTPFFTNKNGGQGIGLTLIRDILTLHGFEFSLKTDADGWTRFVIQF